MASFGRQERDLEHAMWRVNFLSSMLQSHRSLRSRDTEWQEKETDYMERLKAAWMELERLRALHRPGAGPGPAPGSGAGAEG